MGLSSLWMYVNVCWLSQYIHFIHITTGSSQMQNLKFEYSTYIFLVQVPLRTEIPRTPSSIWPGFELMISRSWQYILYQRHACSNHSATSDFKRNVLLRHLRGLRWFLMCSQIDWCTGNWQFWFKYDLGHKYHAPHSI